MARRWTGVLFALSLALAMSRAALAGDSASAASGAACPGPQPVAASGPRLLRKLRPRVLRGLLSANVDRAG